jgi:hypothetical protein
MKKPVADEHVLRLGGVVLKFLIAPTVVAIADVKSPMIGINRTPVEFVIPSQFPRGGSGSNTRDQRGRHAERGKNPQNPRGFRFGWEPKYHRQAFASSK